MARTRDRRRRSAGRVVACVLLAAALAAGLAVAAERVLEPPKTLDLPQSPAAPAQPRPAPEKPGGKPPPPPPPPPPTPGGAPQGPAVPQVCGGVPALTAAEAQTLAELAAAARPEPLTVAVVDRLGNVLALYRVAGADPAADEIAVGLARTGAFFSNDQAPLSSRTVRFISGLHFPPRVARTPNAALYGIENTNRGCELSVTFNPGKAVPPAKRVGGGPCNPFNRSGCGTGPVTGKLDAFDSDQAALHPGGLPVFRGSTLVGGIGVTGPGAPGVRFEEAALFALFSAGFLPVVAPPGQVFIDGIRLPFVANLDPPGAIVAAVPPGVFVVAPGNGACAPDGWLVGPKAGAFLSRADVERIVNQAVATASRTRAVIRLPLGSRARMVFAVADVDGEILGLFRMPDATIFSIDVAVAKSRNVAWLSSPAGKADLPGVPGPTAVTNRTVSFGAQPLYPPGIDGTPPGPFFGLFQADFANPCTQGSQPANPNQNGIVFFPGSIPLYSGQTLIGGLGVSGDGVEQDDYVSFFGADGFQPPQSQWADQIFVNGVRLPFLKFPRNPEG